MIYGLRNNEAVLFVRLRREADSLEALSPTLCLGQSAGHRIREEEELRNESIHNQIVCMDRRAWVGTESSRHARIG
jgi:hypothetical protein